jgi:hypothetical protein
VRADGAFGNADAFALLARWNYSLTAFYLQRWQRQLVLPFRLARSASASDLAEIRHAFEADLRADYHEQAQALRHACIGGTPAAAEAGDVTYGAELLKAQEHARHLLDQAKAQADRIVAAAQERADKILAEAAPKRPQSRAASA